jgi:hypothetical protein
MKLPSITLMILAILTSCRSSGTRETKTSTRGGTEWTLSEMWKTDTLMTTCESVRYDQTRNLLFVSCINGNPSDKNRTGFISKLRPDGTIESLNWVSGLNAPKGMGIIGNLLYVADIDQLVIIDIPTAIVIEKLNVEGASFLNDVSIGPDGKVYFTDSDTGYIWIYSNGVMKSWITEGLNRPNGLYVEESRVLLTSSGSEDLKVIDKSTGNIETVTSGIGQGDGIEFTGSAGFYITTSWAGEIFLILPDYSKISLLKTSDQEINSADIGFNTAAQVLYVPTFYNNRVVAYKLERTE